MQCVVQLMCSIEYALYSYWMPLLDHWNCCKATFSLMYSMICCVFHDLLALCYSIFYMYYVIRVCRLYCFIWDGTYFSNLSFLTKIGATLVTQNWCILKIYVNFEQCFSVTTHEHDQFQSLKDRYLSN